MQDLLRLKLDQLSTGQKGLTHLQKQSCNVEDVVHSVLFLYPSSVNLHQTYLTIIYKTIQKTYQSSAMTYQELWNLLFQTESVTVSFWCYLYMGSVYSANILLHLSWCTRRNDLKYTNRSILYLLHLLRTDPNTVKALLLSGKCLSIQKRNKCNARNVPFSINTNTSVYMLKLMTY